MRIGLIVDRDAIPRWVAMLRARIAAAGHDTGLVLVHGDELRRRSSRRSGTFAALLRLDRVLEGSSRTWLVDDISGTSEASALPRFDTSTPLDLAIDVAGTTKPAAHAPRTLSPRFDGLTVEAGLWPALVSGRAPCIAVLDSATGRETTLALPALNLPQRLYASSQTVLGHLVRALTRAALDVAAGRPATPFATEPPPAPRPDASAHVTRGDTSRFVRARLTSAIANRQNQILKTSAVWQVAWRRTSERTHPPQQLDVSAFRRIPDDGQRYYADPFVIQYRGTTHLFVEELSYALGRGVISHVELGPEGPRGALKPVLEEPHHLSYPQVFEHEGQIYMFPEGTASGRLTLYRADPFPDRWVRHAVPIDEPLHDATLFPHGGRLWLTATTAFAEASPWDTLSIWSADKLEGPWRPHRGNPVLVDARAARPAGMPYEKDGALWRPAQDCRDGYGAALSLCRVSELTETRFAQEIREVLHYGVPSSHAGPHTINFAGGFEVIDLFAPRPPRSSAG